MALRIRAGLGALVALALVAGCASIASPQPTPSFDDDVPPRWVEEEDIGDPRVPFSEGAEFGPESRIEFGSRLGGVYDWEAVGSGSGAVRELVNANAGCRVRDETTPYEGEADDEAASRDLVLRLLEGAEIIGGPQSSIAGIGEGLGEGAPHYEVMHALAEDASGGYVYVSARVFAAAGIQNSLTVHCELGGYLDRTRAQLIQATWVELDLPENTPPPVVVERRCVDDDVAIDVEPFAPGVTEVTGILSVRNVGPETCSVDGYPVVHLAAAGSSAPFGPAAEHGVSYAAAPFDLRPGEAATASLTIRLAATLCPDALPADGVLIGLPADVGGAAVHVPLDGLSVCADPSIGLVTVGGLGR